MTFDPDEVDWVFCVKFVKLLHEVEIFDGGGFVADDLTYVIVD